MNSTEYALRDVVIAGASANVIESIIMHPLDSIKTRYHLLHGKTSIFGTLKQMLRSGGVMQVYRGLLPAVSMQAPRGMFKFTSNAIFNKVLSNDGSGASARSSAAAGLLTGVSESFLITPFEIVKVRLQAANRLTERNSFTILKNIISEEGVATLMRGLEATMYRNGLWNMVYFSSVFKLRQICPSESNSKWTKVVYGTLAGSFGAVFSNPIDVCKSRIQNNVVANRQFIPQLVFSVYRSEGVLALYRGFAAKLLRLGPGGGVLLITYESVLHLIHG